MTVKHSFSVPDYVVFGITIGLSLLIGVYTSLTGGKQRTTNEYLVGDRKLKVLPVALSLIVSYESSIMMLGFPGEIYVYGCIYMWSCLSWIIATSIIAFLMVPTFYDLKLVSAYEYLEGRFKSRGVRLFGSFLGALANLFYMGIVLYGPATALEAVTGFGMWYSIVIVAVVGVIYTAMGGIKAVVLADAFQTLIMIGGMLAVIIKGTLLAGGVSKVFQANSEGKRLNFLNFDPNPIVRHTFWGIIIGGLSRTMGMGSNQTSVQRIATMPSKKKAIGVTMLSGPGFLLFGMLAFVEGMVAFAYYYWRGCDPLQAKLITNPNQIIPFFVMELFHEYPGLPGLFLAALFSASLSTLSSGYASIAAIVWTDFIKPHCRNLSEFKATLVVKVLVVIACAISIGIALLVMTVGGTMNQIGAMLQSSFSTPLAALFLLGGLFPWATGKGALVGIIIGSTISVWKGMGTSFSPLSESTPYLPGGGVENCSFTNITNTFQNVSLQLNTTVSSSWPPLKTFYLLSYQWISPLAMLTTIVGGLLISLITGVTPREERERKYNMPLDRLFCYCPRKLRLKCRCDFPDTPESVEKIELSTFNEHKDNPHNDS